MLAKNKIHCGCSLQHTTTSTWGKTDEPDTKPIAFKCNSCFADMYSSFNSISSFGITVCYDCAKEHGRMILMSLEDQLNIIKSLANKSLWCKYTIQIWDISRKHKSSQNVHLTDAQIKNVLMDQCELDDDVVEKTANAHKVKIDKGY
jgi:hypothetical protein